MEVLDFIDRIENDTVRELLFAADEYLLSLFPQGGRHQLKYRIPFYLVKKSVCYINPHKDHITIGFPQGYRMSNAQNNLLGAKEKLKQVRYVKVFTSEFLYSDELALLLQEALLLDEQHPKSHRSRKL